MNSMWCTCFFIIIIITLSMDGSNALAGWQRIGQPNWAMYAPPDAAPDEQTCGIIRGLLETLHTLSKNSPSVDCPKDVEAKFARELYSVTVSDLPLSPNLWHPLNAS